MNHHRTNNHIYSILQHNPEIGGRTMSQVNNTLHLSITILKGAHRNLSQKQWLHYNSTQSSIGSLGKIHLDHTILAGIIRTPTKGVRNSSLNAGMILDEWPDLSQLLQVVDLILAQIRLTIDIDE